MSITIELAPAVEARFQEEARKHGMSLSEYVEHALEGIASDPVLHAFLAAPEDDEDETEEERQAVEQGYRDAAVGRLRSHQEVFGGRTALTRPRVIIWTHQAEKDLKQLDQETVSRVEGAMDLLAATGRGDMRRLKGSWK